MTDVVVTVPMDRWEDWIAEGDLPGEEWSGEVFDFYLGGSRPTIAPGERVYIVAHGKLRGWAPLREIAEPEEIAPYHEVKPRAFSLVRTDGAVACTIDEPIRGFRGWRYRWWQREAEKPFPDWRTP